MPKVRIAEVSEFRIAEVPTSRIAGASEIVTAEVLHVRIADVGNSNLRMSKIV